MLTRLVVVLPVLVLAIACGGAPAAGPSPIAAPPPATSAVAVPVPAAPDPTYLRSIAILNAAGEPKRWIGGLFHHCAGPEIDPQVVEETAALVSHITGIPRTSEGPCNVVWRIEPSLPATQNAVSELHGGETTIVYAVMMFRGAYAFRFAEHESGHVMGLQHSQRPDDCMAASGPPRHFSPDELAVFAWIYGR